MNIAAEIIEPRLTDIDIDRFKFNGETGHKYLIIVKSNFDIHLAITKYQNEMFILIADNYYIDSSIYLGGNVQSALLWECDVSGDYYISVSANSDMIGYYSISFMEQMLE